ncbi:sulfotransferase family protein [Streptomyces showdoensis]|uniref:Aromatic ring-opening dioxygenase LigA n=1 Tax=Streptomyces showdoensis TaxID=68268 RepID=A0A2P2GQG6_STREW|nr:sulfotransferase [Streptomyces showdoensis]KKZ73754.1 aromatic ring-opening dioxygenase LigA [Streptomyces showdoensis]
MRSLTFVVGTGRSGSTALSRILSAHPEVLSLNEYMASVGSTAFPGHPVGGAEFWRALAEPTPHFAGLLRSGLALPEFLYTRLPGGRYDAVGGIPALSLMVLPHLTDDPDGLLDALAGTVSAWPERSPAAHHRALFDDLCGRLGRTHVVERSGYSTPWAALLRRTFPEARFVHLFRDGPDCALSMSRHVGYRTIIQLREIEDRCGGTPVAELTAEQVRGLPPHLAALLGETFDPALVDDRPLPAAAFGELWSTLVADGVAFMGSLPAERGADLAYEDLLDDPAGELTRLAEFIGVTPDSAWLRDATASLDSGRRGAARTLPAGERTALERACAPGARALATGRGEFRT